MSAIRNLIPSLAGNGNKYLRANAGASALEFAAIDLSGYATLASPALSGTPTAPTAAGGTNTTQIATCAFANTAAAAAAAAAVDGLVGAAPAALNTIYELAAQMATDESAAGALTTLVAGKEPAIAAGTTSQYWRGDKSWQTLNLDSMSDVVIASAAANDVLYHNGTNFVNAPPDTAGLVAKTSPQLQSASAVNFGGF